MDDIIWDAIVRANKLGRQNLEVCGYSEPQSATSDPRIILGLKIPESQSGCELGWWEK